jgi:hypothetical protein
VSGPLSLTSCSNVFPACRGRTINRSLLMAALRAPPALR